VRVTIIVLTAAAALAGLVLSRRPEAAAPPVAPTAAVNPSTTQPPQPSDRSAVGTLERVDSSAQQITVTTTSGSLVFHLVPDATIRQGSKSLKPSELAAHKGERVKVRYRERGTERRADWIVLAAPARRTRAPRA
jgi:hypothetical protein